MSVMNCLRKITFALLLFSAHLASGQTENRLPEHINLPNKDFYSSTRRIHIFENRMRIQLSSNEIIELEVKQAFGPTMPGDYLYMDNDSENPQVVIGNCKQLETIVCFFETSEPESSLNRDARENSFLIYNIELSDKGEFLSARIQKFREDSQSGRILLKTIEEDFFPPTAAQSSPTFLD